jgi:hypothetical protein
MVETELAVITLVHDPMVVGRRELGHVSFVPIDSIQEAVERRAQIEATPATVADLVDSQRFFLQQRWVGRIDQTQALHGPFPRKQSAVSPRRRISSEPKTDR